MEHCYSFFGNFATNDMTEASPELSVVITAYNEEDGVEHCLQEYRSALNMLAVTYEIVFIEDASTDNTYSKVCRFAETMPELRILRNERNSGQLLSLLRGFQAARGKLITLNAVDLPFSPWDTVFLLESYRRGADLVIVERRNRSAYTMYRKIVSWTNIVLIKILLRSPYMDHNFVIAFDRQLLDTITVESRGVSTGMVEFILKAHHYGYRIARLQLDYHPRIHGKSSITWRKVLHNVFELLRLWRILYRWRRQYATNRND